MHEVAHAGHGMVVSAHEEASSVGIRILLQQGNAVDAAVATALAIGVVEPHNTGLGGYGGFATIFVNEGSRTTCVDFNTRSPTMSNEDSCLDLSGAKSIGVPAVLSGLTTMLRLFGTKKFREVVTPAIELARDGFAVNESMNLALKTQSHIDAVKLMFCAHDSVPDVGTRVSNPRYANFLNLLYECGEDSFYRGQLARDICAFLGECGSELTPQDLQSYSPNVYEALAVECDDVRILTPGSASGGDLVRRIVRETWDLREQFSCGVRDPDNVTKRLRIIQNAWSEIRPYHRDYPPVASTGQHTTHICVVDNEGNAVSLTLTHGPLWFGSGVVMPEYGLIFNNGLSLFSVKKGSPASYAPRLSPMTNMAPTIVTKGSKLTHVLGTPGGTRISSTVANLLIDVLGFHHPVEEAVALPRFHAENHMNEWWMEKELYDTFRSRAGELGIVSKLLSREQFYGPLSVIQMNLSKPPRFTGITDTRFPGAAIGLC